MEEKRDNRRKIEIYKCYQKNNNVEKCIEKSEEKER